MNGRGRVRLGAIFLAISLASFATWALTPGTQSQAGTPPLSQLVPANFGDWREIDLPAAAVDPREQTPGETDREAPYDEVLMRGYRNSQGDLVLLALAYGRHQRQEVKIHRPELCYTAQGFKVLDHSPVAVAMPGAATSPALGARMLVRGADRVEAVSYWIRIGRVYGTSAWTTRAHIFNEGLHGRRVDGMLVRVSQIVPDSASATPARFELQERFLADLVRAVPAEKRGLLIGEST